MSESVAIHPEQRRLFEGDDAGRSSRLIERAHLAEGLARAEDRDDHVSAVHLFNMNFYGPAENEINNFARLLDGHQMFSRRKGFSAQQDAQLPQVCVWQIPE